MYDIDLLEKEIESAKQLENITEAMQQAAARYLVKFRKTVLDSREYINQMWKTYDVVRDFGLESFYLEPGGNVLAITPNKGMYGSLVIKSVDAAYKISRESKLNLVIAGRKGIAPAERVAHGKYWAFEYDDNFELGSLTELIKKIGGNKRVVVVYPKYESTFNQKIDVVELGDVIKASVDRIEPGNKMPDKNKYLFDPSAEEITRYFSQSLLSMIIYKYFVEAALAYKSSQMIAMKRACDNAKSTVTEKQLKYFRTKRSIVDVKLREITANRGLWEGVV